MSNTDEPEDTIYTVGPADFPVQVVRKENRGCHDCDLFPAPVSNYCDRVTCYSCGYELHNVTKQEFAIHLFLTGGK